ncbi:MAG: 2Fe-2S iron-sulfur cluster binding domain-containing protein [Ferruginibacter sp.]|nr:2Fe-2S iron-sulfur cluster binding domain-containing protein [Rhodoferax sp.]
MRHHTACYSARIGPGDMRFDAPADLPLLLAAEQAGLLLASACRNGSCRSCICRLVSGQVAYRIAWPGLSAEEKAGGCILPCVAYPVSDVVVQLPAQAGTTTFADPLAAV